MIIAIDVGNTNIVVGCIDAKGIIFVERLSANRHRTEMEYAISLKSILELHEVSPKRIEGGIICSVVPELTAVLKGALEKFSVENVKVVGPGVKSGMNIVIDQPAQLGSDLLVDAVAAAAEYPLPVVIVDLGTATTFSVVNEKKQYIGGIVLPGVRTGLDSLVEQTSLLPQIALEAPRNLIGRNTIDCMKSGVIFGHASAIDNMIRRIELELKRSCTVVATGALAEAVIPHCERKIPMDPDLLLKGLKIIYDKNR
ncbi:MAG: type III pantothenate kinase [Lachnospiraceae bacterium]|nr:type III pantothenate kinase [Lachnospiraceae bacterium]